MLVCIYDQISDGLYNKFTSVLDMNYSKVISCLAECDNSNVKQSIMEMKEDLIRYVTQVKSSIAEFFSNRNVIPEIHTVYNKLSSNANPHNKLSVCDVNLAIHHYNEYFEGLNEFVDVTMGIKSNELDLMAVNKKISEAIINDGKYIDKTIWSEDNACKDESLSECMKQVEFLIDFIPTISEYETKATQNYDKLINIMNDDIELNESKIRVMYLQTRSIMHYLYSIVSYVVQIFYNICMSLKERTPVSGKQVIPMKLF